MIGLSYKLISVKCPECGHVLSIEENRTEAYCTYCGTKVLISNENEYVFRQVDEADIKKAETERLIRLKELDLQEQRETHGRNLRRVLTAVWLVVSVALLGIIIVKLVGTPSEFGSGFLMLLYIGGPIIGGGAYLIFKWLPEKENERIIVRKGALRFPSNLFPFSEQKYFAAETTLRSVGFTNISCVNLHDLNLLSALISNDKVVNITVNGDAVVAKKYYMPNVPIVITYHGR